MRGTRETRADGGGRRARSRRVAAGLLAGGLLALGAPAAGAQGAGTAGAADSLTVAACAELARGNGPESRISSLSVEAARLDSAAAARNRRLHFSLFGGATVAPDGFYDPALTNLGEYELKTGVELPLFDGGERERERVRAANEAAQAGLELDRARRDAAIRAAGLAIEILRLQERERILSESLSWLDGLEDLIQSSVRAGGRGPSDQLRVALEADAERTALESARTDLGIATRALNQEIGRPVESPPTIREPRPDEEAEPTPADSLRLMAGVDHLAEVRAARVAVAQQRVDLSEARGRTAARVDASADAGFWGSDLSRAVPQDLRAANPNATFSDRLRRDLGASASLAFRVPLADRAAPLSVRAREAGVKAAALGLATESDTQQRTARDLLARWRSAARRIAVASSLVDRGETNLLRQKSLYLAGAVTLLDLLDARRMLDDARGELAEARAGARAARFEAEARQ